MNWLLRSAIAAISLGSAGTTLFGEEAAPPRIGTTTGAPAFSGPKPPPVVQVQYALPAPPVERPEYLPPFPLPAPANPSQRLADEQPVLPRPALPDIPVLPRTAIPEPPSAVNTPTPDAIPTLGANNSDAPETPILAPEMIPDNNCPTRRLTSICDPVPRLLPQDRAVRARGWLNGGYVYNTSNPNSKFNGPYNSIDRSAEPMFNQGYLILDRPLPTDGSFGAGFRIDALFGYDFYLGQSRGFEVDRDFGDRWNGQYYGLAIPQVYTEIGNDFMSLKLGHFYTTVGYESLQAPANFFYSRAYSYQFGQPITHWGGLLTTQLTRNVQVHTGLVNGWDTLVGRTNNINFLGGILYTPDSNRWWTSFTLVTGHEQTNPAGLPDVPNTAANRTRYSFLLGLTPGGPCGRWEYVFHNYYGWQEDGTPQLYLARWYGIDQYLYYRLSRTVRLGTRFEWFRDEDGTRVGLNRPANPNVPPLPGNYFSLTGGINYTPTANFMIRPEVRWDFTSNTSRPAFNDGSKNNQLLFGCDLIWQF